MSDTEDAYLRYSAEGLNAELVSDSELIDALDRLTATVADATAILADAITSWSPDRRRVKAVYGRCYDRDEHGPHFMFWSGDVCNECVGNPPPPGWTPDEVDEVQP